MRSTLTAILFGLACGLSGTALADNALDTYRELLSDLVDVRVDARMNLSKHPKEARRCINTCNRLESAINRARGELIDGHVESETLSAFKDASLQFLIAERDLYEAIANPARPYQIPKFQYEP